MLSLIVSLSLATFVSAEEPSSPPLGERFEQLVKDADEAGVDALFRERPYEVIYLVDEYLEGFVGQSEKAEGERVAEPAVLLDLATFAATRADHVFETDVFGRMVEARRDWKDGDLARYRASQERYREGRDALRDREYDRAATAYEESRALAEELGDLRGLALSTQRLGDLAFGGKDMKRAIELHTAALDLLGPMHHPNMLRSCRALAICREQEGDLEATRGLLERMLEAARSAGREEVAGPVKADLVRVCRELGDEDAAKRYDG